MQHGGALGEMALAIVTLAIDGAMRIALWEGGCALVVRRFCKAGAATFAALQAISATRLRQEEVLCSSFCCLLTELGKGVSTLIFGLSIGSGGGAACPNPSR